MAESASTGVAPRYMVKAFATAESAQQWLLQCSEAAYHFVSMSSIESTNHFSKELEGLMWMVVERDTDIPQDYEPAAAL